MNNYNWSDEFRKCWDKAVGVYRAGNREPSTYFNREELAFLESIGCSAQEMYDFAEDWCQVQEPSFETALLVTAARRDYFLVIQKGKPSKQTIRADSLPSKQAEVAGFVWLPRIIAKARAKLRGELPAELMYCCGGDRAFLRKTNIHPADFLRVVWAVGDDDQKIIDYVKKQASTLGDG